jgi:hypothetical protein
LALLFHGGKDGFLYAADRDQILVWSGGHCAHSGTEIPIYSIKTDRWRITYPPEFPIEFCYSNGGTPGQWSFHQRPWMTGHTYHDYAYDPVLKKVVVSGKGAYTYIFDPDKGDFEPPAMATPSMPTSRRAKFIIVNMYSRPRFSSPTREPIAPSLSPTSAEYRPSCS